MTGRSALPTSEISDAAAWMIEASGSRSGVGDPAPALELGAGSPARVTARMLLHGSTHGTTWIYLAGTDHHSVNDSSVHPSEDLAGNLR